MTDAALVRRLDAAEAHRAAPELAVVLIACVEAGASVSFMPPLDPDRAAAFWRARADQVGAGKRALIAARLDGVVVGVVTLDFDLPENQPHRAEVQKMLVHPAARRRGIGAALMREAEAAALAAGRRLLTLDTAAGGDGERLYRKMKWLHAGLIPGYALNPDGSFCDTLLFWKRLG